MGNNLGYNGIGFLAPKASNPSPSLKPTEQTMRTKWFLGGRFGFFFFVCSGPGGWGVSRTGGAEGPGGCLRRIGESWGGGGVNFFFFGPKCPPRFKHIAIYIFQEHLLFSVKSTRERWEGDGRDDTLRQFMTFRPRFGFHRLLIYLRVPNGVFQTVLFRGKRVP